MSETSRQRSRWLLPAALVSLTAACASVSATSMQYVGSPHVPPSDPAVIEILRAEPSRPHERLGEVSVTASTRPSPALAEVEEKLRTAASTLGADAVVVVQDALQPVGWYSTGTIRAEYLDAVAVVVRKSDAPAPVGGASVVRLAPRGEKPAGVVVDTVETTGRVEAVDLATRRVTLSGPGGGVMVIPVDDRVSRLDEVKAGDEVVIRHTQALAIRLDR